MFVKDSMTPSSGMHNGFTEIFEDFEFCAVGLVAIAAGDPQNVGLAAVIGVARSHKHKVRQPV